MKHEVGEGWEVETVRIGGARFAFLRLHGRLVAEVEPHIVDQRRAHRLPSGQGLSPEYGSPRRAAEQR
jgi:hypothetical protein